VRTKSRARVVADRERGKRPRKNQQKATLVGVQPIWEWSDPRYRTYLTPTNVQAATFRPPPGPVVIGDYMRHKFALRSARDGELSRAYTEAQVNEIMNRYGPL